MPRILLIDDDEAFRNMLHKTLERAGYEVQPAADGKQALELFRQQHPDLIITDLVMPEKEGLETILELRREAPNAKIIAMSGGSRMNPRTSLAMAEKFGARKTLSKPFSHQEILDAVSDVLNEAA